MTRMRSIVAVVASLVLSDAWAQLGNSTPVIHTGNPDGRAASTSHLQTDSVARAVNGIQGLKIIEPKAGSTHPQGDIPLRVRFPPEFAGKTGELELVWEAYGTFGTNQVSLPGIIDRGAHVWQVPLDRLARGIVVPRDKACNDHGYCREWLEAKATLKFRIAGEVPERWNDTVAFFIGNPDSRPRTTALTKGDGSAATRPPGKVAQSPNLGASAQPGNAPQSALGSQAKSATPDWGKASVRQPNAATSPRKSLESAVVRPPQTSAQSVTPAHRAANSATQVVTPERLTVTFPVRAILLRQDADLRAEQDALAQPGQRRSIDRRASAPAGAATAGKFASSSSPLRNAVNNASRVRTEPGIDFVNGRESGIQLTPGGKVVVTGRGFGETQGRVSLVGGALDARPLPLLIIKWHAEQIEAAIPGSTRGVPDVPQATLQVKTAAGTIYRLDGVSFHAAREETTLTGDRVGAFFIVEPGGTWPKVDAASAHVGRYESSSYESSSRGVDCKRPGTDVLRFRTVHGFDVIGATLGHGRTDSGDGDENGQPGGRVFFPGYGFGAWTDEHVTRPLPEWSGLIGTEAFVSALRVNWGVFRSHTSSQVRVGANDVSGIPVPYVNHGGEWDTCSSYYVITSLRLYGPAGVAP